MSHKKMQEQIQEWQKQGLIDGKTAEKMTVDLVEKKQEDQTSNIIVSLSTIGVIAVGIGAILFVGSSWQWMANSMKVIVLIGATTASYMLGYILQYRKANFPKVGAALLFLGALLFGASVFLIAQMYNVNAHNHVLLLVWLAGVVPLAYGFLSRPTMVLSLFIFFLWIGFFLFRGGNFDEVNWYHLPIIYALTGVLVFEIGSLHYAIPPLGVLGKLWKVTGLKVGMASFFLLIFDIFHTSSFGLGYNRGGGSTTLFLFGMILVTIIANIMINPQHRKRNTFENIMVSVPVICIFFYIHFFVIGNVSLLVCNLVFMSLSIFFIIYGYMEETMELLNTGIFWTGIFISVKYFDWFWGLLDRSLFFTMGGIILVVGGAAIESKRRALKKSFVPSIK